MQLIDVMSTPAPNPSSPLYAYRKRYGLSYAALGELLGGVNKTTVRYWERLRVPAERVPEINRVTGIPAHDLRPDLFTPPWLMGR